MDEPTTLAEVNPPLLILYLEEVLRTGEALPFGIFLACAIDDICTGNL